jgi:quercetin dioxygenase-like cupin family protein
MRIYRAGAADGHPITQFGSEHVDITGIARILAGEVQIGYMHLEPGGRVGAHEATTRQLFLVVRGEGWVRGPEAEHTAIVVDQAAYWEPGEQHESGSDGGMVALVIEGDALDPDQFLRLLSPGKSETPTK